MNQSNTPKELLSVSPSPHLRGKDTTGSIMMDVIIALAPAAVWGVYVFGTRALLMIAVCILSCVGAEQPRDRSGRGRSDRRGKAPKASKASRVMDEIKEENEGKSEEEKQEAEEKFAEETASGINSALNIVGAAASGSTVEKEDLKNDFANVLESDVCVDSLNEITEDEEVKEKVQNVTANMDEETKEELKQQVQDKINQNPEKEEDYKKLAESLGIPLDSVPTIPGGNTGSDNTGSDDTGSDDTGSDDTGSDDTGSDDTGSDDTGSDNTGSEGFVLPEGMTMEQLILLLPEGVTIEDVLSGKVDINDLLQGN
jgi:hypothetical protein